MVVWVWLKCETTKRSLFLADFIPLIHYKEISEFIEMPKFIATCWELRNEGQPKQRKRQNHQVIDNLRLKLQEQSCNRFSCYWNNLADPIGPVFNSKQLSITLISLILLSSEQVIPSGRTPKSLLNGWGEDWSNAPSALLGRNLKTQLYFSG